MDSNLTSPPRQPATRTVAILLFDGVELLDFAGPFEVFYAARLARGPVRETSDAPALFRVLTLGRSEGAVEVRGGLHVTPHFSLEKAPPVQILVVPGGQGTRSLLEDREFLDSIRSMASEAKLVASVCTGALLLAKAGLLKNRRATTHWASLDLLASIDPTTEIDASARVVDDGVFTCGGISAGIDLALCIVEKLCGKDVADDTARHIDYRSPWWVARHTSVGSAGA
ncbi:MAG: DJ-1/PfpI family protein [Acidobacteriota bacterium]